MQTKTTIYIVRHGESEANIKKLYGSVPKSDLTLKGVNQIEALSEKLYNIPFDCVFSSDFVRARKTAKILAAKRSTPIIIDNKLRERNYGRLNGLSREEVKLTLGDLFDKYEKMSNKEKYYFRLVKNMETVEEVVSRCVTVLKEAVIQYKEKNILVVSHVIPMRGLLVYFGFVDYHQIDSGCIENGAYIKLESDGISFVVRDTTGIRTKNEDRD